MMKTEVEKKDKQIICTISSLKYSDRRCKGRNYMDTKRVRRLLVEQGHNPGDNLVQSTLDNKVDKLSGIWIFEDADYIKKETLILEKTEPNLVKPRTSNRRKNSRKSKKVLDKSVEDVIIEE